MEHKHEWDNQGNLIVLEVWRLIQMWEPRRSYTIVDDDGRAVGKRTAAQVKAVNRILRALQRRIEEDHLEISVPTWDAMTKRHRLSAFWFPPDMPETEYLAQSHEVRSTEELERRSRSRTRAPQAPEPATMAA